MLAILHFDDDFHMPDLNALRALIKDLDGRSAALRGYL